MKIRLLPFILLSVLSVNNVSIAEASTRDTKLQDNTIKVPLNDTSFITITTGKPVEFKHLLAQQPNATAQEIFNAITANHKVVVDFYASWCGPCKKLAVTIAEVAPLYPEIVFLKVDTQDSTLDALKDRYVVRAYPTIIVFNKGLAPKFKKPGAPSKSDLIANYINKFLA